jgi:hypothetical protein
MNDNPFVGKWTYRSLLNDPNVNTDFDKLEFGRGTITIEEGPMDLLTGTIGGPGWSLALHGSRAYGSPMQVRFQGKGIVSGSQWIYDYVGWLVPVWPNRRGPFRTRRMGQRRRQARSHRFTPCGRTEAAAKGLRESVTSIGRL